MEDNIYTTRGSWDIMKELNINRFELYTWHLVDLKLQDKTDGIFVKEVIKSNVVRLKIAMLIIDCEIMQIIICSPSEFDDVMKKLKDNDIRIRKDRELWMKKFEEDPIKSIEHIFKEDDVEWLYE